MLGNFLKFIKNFQIKITSLPQNILLGQKEVGKISSPIVIHMEKVQFLFIVIGKSKKTMSGKSYWGYIEARKKIYFPLYAKAVIETSALKELKERVLSSEKIALWDFDGYDHAKRGMTYKDVVHNEKYKCGHACMYGLITKQIVVKNNELIFNFN